MKNASTLHVVIRILRLFVCSAATLLLYVVTMIPLIWVMSPMGISKDVINAVALILVAVLYMIPLCKLHFSEHRMEPAKRFFLANSADGWKPVDMVKRYFKEFGAMDGIVAALPVLAASIGILLGSREAGFLALPIAVFQFGTKPSFLGVLAGILLFCVEYICCLLIRFRKWDKERLHR